MEHLLSIVIATIFILLALLHLFWVFGGKWGISATIPTDLNGRRVFNPGRPGTLLVAIGLLFFALTNLCAIGVLKGPFDNNYAGYGMYMISGIFFVRFIGDLKYVGVFKKYRNTVFASRDTYIYTPLSLFLSISNGILAVMF
ncbi:DUF3995 domain-containing protein [Sphingobacterium sp. DR205]|uniref:DUF3995 domain-containing protein n=1 Tax=Sphingobacterium sp. DR205 TaxID=2713573 RepID=UPI0013E4B7A9|nr:DUF3995 domain-containing protein [Sphingobacterium sp. DR205]QIH34913.1 DUF3995 domain-containing protein [Sphingobacterium sp. DR205]